MRAWPCGLWGLSPRVRGNPPGLRFPSAGRRSIPACAGEPTPTWTAEPAAWVYPRVCGGTRGVVREHPLGSGLSPRVRGNRGGGQQSDRQGGSIPACAGEPPGRCPAAHRRGVYPRVCGGTGRLTQAIDSPDGLSPRVRGNRSPSWPAPGKPGSIPACAGEPAGCGRWRSPHPVYPRVCGGTPLHRWRASRRRGLSPRVRGNH